jgi:hypothetical protein
MAKNLFINFKFRILIIGAISFLIGLIIAYLYLSIIDINNLYSYIKNLKFRILIVGATPFLIGLIIAYLYSYIRNFRFWILIIGAISFIIGLIIPYLFPSPSDCCPPECDFVTIFCECDCNPIPYSLHNYFEQIGRRFQLFGLSLFVFGIILLLAQFLARFIEKKFIKK